MKIAIGADHAGYRLKEHLIAHGLSQHQVLDVGTHSEESTDYPIYAFRVARLVASGEADLGVLICGPGIGMTLAILEAFLTSKFAGGRHERRVRMVEEGGAD